MRCALLTVHDGGKLVHVAGEVAAAHSFSRPSFPYNRPNFIYIRLYIHIQSNLCLHTYCGTQFDNFELGDLLFVIPFAAKYSLCHLGKDR